MSTGGAASPSASAYAAGRVLPVDHLEECQRRHAGLGAARAQVVGCGAIQAHTGPCPRSAASRPSCRSSRGSRPSARRARAGPGSSPESSPRGAWSQWLERIESAIAASAAGSIGRSSPSLRIFRPASLSRSAARVASLAGRAFSKPASVATRASSRTSSRARFVATTGRPAVYRPLHDRPIDLPGRPAALAPPHQLGDAVDVPGMLARRWPRWPARRRWRRLRRRLRGVGRDAISHPRISACSRW